MRNNKATQSSGLNGAGSVLAYSSRDSPRIVKHTFDAAKIDIISESCKYFSDYFRSGHFVTVTKYPDLDVTHFVTVTKYPDLDVTQILLTPVFHGMTSYGSVVSSPTFP